MQDWQASFKRLQDAPADDVRRLMRHDVRVARELPDRVLAHLALLDGEAGGWPVNRYRHSLLAATLAQEAGRDEEYVVCALLHDIGDTLGSYNHADLAATVLEPFVGDANLWMLKHHGIVQGYHFFHHIGLDRHLRDTLREHEHYERTLEFVDRFDNAAFDASATVLPISHFEPMVRRLLARPSRSVYLEALSGMA
jgi:predicted HD phosphohydrolase